MEQLSRVPLAAFHRAINKVARSLIRTDADELTYNLHIMLRFDLELKMLEGLLRVRDLPEAWHTAMRADLGIAPSDDRDGCLQDAHWYSGYIGGRFQSYAIGNILSAQFYAAALKAHPDILHEIAKGEFGTLHSWLCDNLYRHGSKFAPNEYHGCVYRKLKLGHNGDAVRQGSRGNGYFQLVELGARKARPYLASDAFAIHYNRRHTRLESCAGALRPV